MEKKLVGTIGDFRFCVGQKILLGQALMDDFFGAVDDMDRAVVLDCFQDWQGRKYVIGTENGREYTFFSQTIDGCCEPSAVN